MKTKKITAAAIGGTSFMYVAPPAYGRTKCPRKGCSGHTVARGRLEYFTCSRKGCNWISKFQGGDGARKRVPAKQTPKVKPRKKSLPDSRTLVAAVRRRCRKRDEILHRERRAMPKPTRKLTAAEREHLHTFAFSSEDVRKELL